MPSPGFLRLWQKPNTDGRAAGAALVARRYGPRLIDTFRGAAFGGLGTKYAIGPAAPARRKRLNVAEFM